MERRDSYTKTVATIGTVLVCYPILRTIYVTLYFLVSQGKVIFPYFMSYQFFMGIFSLAIVLLGIGGVLLLSNLFRYRALQ